jgi:hypothetical protein
MAKLGTDGFIAVPQADLDGRYVPRSPINQPAAGWDVTEGGVYILGPSSPGTKPLSDNQWWVVDVINYSPDWTIQRAYNPFKYGNATDNDAWERGKITGNGQEWQSWRKAARRSDDSDARYALRAGNPIQFRSPDGAAGLNMILDNASDWPVYLRPLHDNTEQNGLLYDKGTQQWQFLGKPPGLFFGTSDPVNAGDLVPYKMISERGKAQTFARSAGVNIGGQPVTIGDWTSAYGDAGVGLNSGWLFFPPHGRWLVTYNVFSDGGFQAGQYVYLQVGEWFGSYGIPWESRSFLEAPGGYPGGGQLINTVSFQFDSYPKNDSLYMQAQTTEYLRTISTSTIQFIRLR